MTKYGVSAVISLSLLVTGSIARADCSRKFFGGDPTGLLTKTAAFSVVNSNPPAAIFLLSDLTPKGLALPTGDGPIFPLGTPFNDFISAPYGAMAAGLNGGNDYLLLADRQQERPGLGEVDVMDAGTQDNGGTLATQFILGDASKRYYAGKRDILDRDRDYAYINHFIKGQSKIRLNGKADDYRLTWITGLFAKSIAGTAIVTQDTCDVIGFVRNELLTDLNGPDFEFAGFPSPTPAIAAGAGRLVGIDQIGGAGDVVVAPLPTATATDVFGNVYMIFGSSSLSIHGIGGPGSFYLVKYDSTGRRLWTRKHGTSPGNDAASGPQVPETIVVYGDNVYVAGVTFGPYGGPKPPKNFLGSDGVVPFIAKFDSDGKLVKAAQIRATPTTALNPAWALAVDNAGDLFLGGTLNDGISIPLGSPYITKINGSTLKVDERFGSGGIVVFRDGPATIFNSLEGLTSFLNNLQITNINAGVSFVPDGSGVPGSGSVYVAGVSDNGSFFGSQPGWNDVWFTKLNASTGDKAWLGNYTCNLRLVCGYSGGYSLSAPGADSFLWAIDVDASGNLYLGGETGGTFSQVGHAEALVSASGTQSGRGDGFVVKVSPDGTVMWRKQVGTRSSDNVRALRVDGSSIYVLGETRGTIADTRSGRTDVFAAKMDTVTGEIQSRLQFGSERMDIPGSISVSANQIYLSGVSEGSVVAPSRGGVEAFLVSVPKSSF